MRAPFLVLAALSLAPFRASAVQTRLSLPPQTHIRVVLPSREVIEAEVLVQRGDSLWVRSLTTRVTSSLALSAVTRLEVSMSQDRHVLRDAGIGLLGGAVIGGLLGSGLGALCGLDDQTEHWRPLAFASVPGPANYLGTRVRTYALGVRIAIH
jgi:hypothetical protein